MLTVTTRMILREDAWQRCGLFVVVVYLLLFCCCYCFMDYGRQRQKNYPWPSGNALGRKADTTHLGSRRSLTPRLS